MLILYNTFTQKKKQPKTYQEQPNLVSGSFIKVFYKMTTCSRRPLLSGPKNDLFIHVWPSVTKRSDIVGTPPPPCSLLKREGGGVELGGGGTKNFVRKGG